MELDFSDVTFGECVTKPFRTIFGTLALFADASHHGQYFASDGTPIGPPHLTLTGAMAYAVKKGWKVEPMDDEGETPVAEPTRAPLPTRPDTPAPRELRPAPGDAPSRVGPKAPRAKKRGK